VTRGRLAAHSPRTSVRSGTLLFVRPLRLILDGFGSYRAETEIDFTDVDFFVLTGPTGAG
jgi:hypothetical protein